MRALAGSSGPTAQSRRAVVAAYDAAIARALLLSRPSDRALVHAAKGSIEGVGLRAQLGDAADAHSLEEQLRLTAPSAAADLWHEGLCIQDGALVFDSALQVCARAHSRQE
mmetsp:Transcript_25742/g.66591  ORF Transcript_25742/g.66591 Transcript_25742/m.66591 type:complete len:111 (-) Transcript_25742:713-1045(-)